MKKTKAELLRGTSHELEHTEDRDIAELIARDHLRDDKDYYDKLEIAEETSLPKLKKLLRMEERKCH